MLEQHAKAAKLDTILAGMDILVTANSRMRNSSHTRAILEMALVRLCQLEDLLPHLVCQGEVDLATAQRDIATDWIAAYKKYFRTNHPIGLSTRSFPSHVRPWFLVLGAWSVPSAWS